MTALARIDPKPWLFAAKTTGACLLAIYVAFVFNLDQPQWTLLTVFIVAQPGTSGGVLGKSCFRLVGTFIGAAVALTLVALFAQERTLFLGTLAIWIGICTFASQRVRSWSNYGFVLSGYTAAIIGIPATLDPGNTFYLAMARVTEICLGVIVGTAVNELILPAPMAASLQNALADVRRIVSGFAADVLNDGDVTGGRAGVVGAATRIDDLLNTAAFEDVSTRLARSRIRGLAATLVDVLATAQPLRRQLGMLSDGCQPACSAGLGRARAEAAEAIASWQSGALDAAALTERLRALRWPEPAPASRDGGLAGAGRRDVVAERFTSFLESFATCARAWEAVVQRRPAPVSLFALDPADDRWSATMTGVRSALAILVSGAFWILTAWPRGYMATLLTGLGTSRAATMGRVVPLAIATTLSFVLAFLPSFIICEVLLPGMSGYPMFALVVGPMLFLFAFLMADRRTFVIGYMGAMLFLNTCGIQNRMNYDPINFINTVVAGIFASSVSGILWALIAPDTPRKERLRFLRTTRRSMRSLLDASAGNARLIGFESAIGGALIRLARSLQSGYTQDDACMEVATALLGAGRELALRPQVPCPSAAVERVRIAMNDCVLTLSHERVDMNAFMRAAQDLGAAMDEFMQRHPPVMSNTKVDSDAC